MNPDVRRIAIFGPESTGKTRLAEGLAAHFGAPWVPEYAREFWDAHGVITLEDIPGIAREQWRREDAAAAALQAHCNPLDDNIAAGVSEGGREAGHPIDDKSGGAVAGGGGLVFCDTEALTTVLWSDLLYGTTPDDVRRTAERRAKNYALYLLLDIDAPFTPDPQRCFPDAGDRAKCRRIWHGALERRQLAYTWIRGGWAERERTAIAAVEALLKGGGSAGSGAH
jgi:nicotinamide riboside kinase